MIKFIKKMKWAIVALVILLVGGGIYLKKGVNPKTGIETVKLKLKRGLIRQVVSTTGVVEPQNRLEIKPSVGGRIEGILFEEGDTVKAGEVLALLSSTERSSLLDAAKLKDQETLTYWEGVYKPIPLVSPINGEVIVRNFEPGQSVTTADAVLVLSDRLIVVAQVDETDIGYIKKGQRAVIKLDAYPDIEVQGQVSHISFESLLVNNVTIYEVNIIPDEISDVFRSGMSANVDIIRAQKNNILLLPNYVIKADNDGHSYVMSEGANGETEKIRVSIGIADEENTEIISGLSETDTVLLSQQRSGKISSQKQSGTNPFMPSRRSK